MPAIRQIVTFGGGGFSMESGNPMLDDYVLGLTGSAEPRVCFLPTASGDADHYVVRFYDAFRERARPSHISLFRRERGVSDMRAHLLAEDLIYVGGGSLFRLLGVWRAHGVDEILRDAWRAGVVLCGLSAGSLCWFTEAVSGYHGEINRVPGLGFFSHSNAVHYGEGERRAAFHCHLLDGMPAGYYRSEPPRRRAFLAAVAAGELGAGLGLEDQTGALLEDRELVQTISAREGARAWEVKLVEGDAEETPLVPRRLEDSRPPINDTRAEILEFRQTLASRAASRRARRSRPGRLD